MRDGTAGGRLAKTIGYAGWDRLAESGASEVSPGFLCGMGPQGEDLLKQLVVRDGTAGAAIADFQVHPLHRLSGFEGRWLHSP